MGTLLLPLIVVLIIQIAIAFMMQSGAQKKGYDESAHAFAISFWLGIPGCIYVASWPDLIVRHMIEDAIALGKTEPSPIVKSYEANAEAKKSVAEKSKITPEDLFGFDKMNQEELMDERKKLEDKMQELNQEILQLPETEEAYQLRKEIGSLQEDLTKAEANIFNKDEKIRIQENIRSLERTRSEVLKRKEKVCEPILQQREYLQKQMEEMEKILEKSIEEK